MKKLFIYFVCFLSFALTACSNPCKEGHTWVNATCESPKSCSVCGTTEGDPLGHTWVSATCTTPKTCSVCGDTLGSTASHNYSTLGKCMECGATKEYSNSYGYFSKSDLFAMAKDAVKDSAYPSYVHNFCSESDIYIEKMTDPKLEYGSDSFAVVASADFVINTITFEGKKFVAVVEPHNSTTYASKDVYSNEVPLG